MSVLDLVVIFSYVAFAFFIGVFVSKKASQGEESYFLADRKLPWWQAGISMAATTFAADTPLAVTGIIAAKGLSGNWMWLSWLFLHLSMVFIFSKQWRKSKVLTDAELIDIRYSGIEAKFLRKLKAFLYGVVFNAIVLGWVLKAMNKIVEPFFLWNEWAPDLVSFVQNVTPSFLMFGSAEEMITTFVLLFLVAVYSSAGGFRGVVITDMFQFAFAIGASYFLAVSAYDYVGGFSGLRESYTSIYNSSEFLNVIPNFSNGWVADIGMGAGVFMFYLLIQSYANNPADGGGYFMQRLAACKDEHHSKKAAFLFVCIHYFIRIWPWFFMGIVALVVIPIGMEGEVFDGKYAFVATDRERAYPALMGLLLSEGGLGLMLASLLAAFMSTIDTHLNWGASYIVNDFYSTENKDASAKQKVRVARFSIFGFMFLAVIVASQIHAIRDAWQWIAYLGAGIGAPTILRWLWWRVNAWSELLALGVSLILALVLTQYSISFEYKLIILGLAGMASTVIGAFIKEADELKVNTFAELVGPMGLWPNREGALKELVLSSLKVVALFIVFSIALFSVGQVIFG